VVFIKLTLNLIQLFGKDIAVPSQLAEALSNQHIGSFCCVLSVCTIFR